MEAVYMVNERRAFVMLMLMVMVVVDFFMTPIDWLAGCVVCRIDSGQCTTAGEGGGCGWVVDGGLFVSCVMSLASLDRRK